MVETLPKFTDAMKQQQIAFDVYPYVAGSTILRKDMLRARRQGADHLVRQVAGMSGRDLKDIAKEMGCSIEGGRRPPAAGRRHLLHDGREGRAGAPWPIPAR